ncbi:UNVERIFIED_CONTAM: hypothetical protein PYX00_011919 [Menopon gallinae]|uniref:Type 2 isopentenyl diphosphate isomerase n=1 Tax=Menopon gallinae TaxID=328185 RepID=A0AAW2H914_9NEOP
MHFGISDIQLFVPQNYLSLRTLVQYRAKEDPLWKEKLSRAVKLTGQKGLRFPYKDQDSVALASEAVLKLLKNNERDLEQLRVFIGGTETGVDFSKSFTSYVQEALASANVVLPTSYASFQVQHACASGVYALFSALALLQMGSRRLESEWGLVIASDISRYLAPSTAEVTQGAGAVALLLETQPKLLRVDLSSIGYSSRGVDDFFRPLDSLTAKVKGRYSIECFNEAFKEAFLNFCQRKQAYPETVLASVSLVVLHTPYAEMPISALKPILREFYSQEEEEVEKYIQSRYVPASCSIAKEVGNLYSASIFASLMAGLKAMYEQLGVEIVGKRVLFASYGSGGMSRARAFNRDLAQVANSLGLAMGLGSHKLLKVSPEAIKDFQVKKWANDVPIFSNIGAVQLLDTSYKWLEEVNKTLEVQAQVIHLNSLQELMQPEGERCFYGIKEAISRFVDYSSLPVIVKETGCGLRAQEVEWLLKQGVAYVDIAGSGGTNWGLVESYRHTQASQKRIQETWKDWGIPSAYTLFNLTKEQRAKCLVSGGMSEALSPVKALVLGASLVGFAHGVLKAWSEEGREGVIRFFQDQEKTLKEAMVLLGHSKLDDLDELQDLAIPLTFKEEAKQWQ